MGRFLIPTFALSVCVVTTWANDSLDISDELNEKELFDEQPASTFTSASQTKNTKQETLSSFDKEFLDLFNDTPSQEKSAKKTSDQSIPSDASMNNQISPVYTPQPVQAQAMPVQSTSSPSQDYKIKSYYAFPDKEVRIYAAIDYLYWTVSEPGMFYATSTHHQYLNQPVASPPVGSSAAYVTGQLGKIQKQTLGWSSGVRGTFGYQFKNTLWNLTADYTYFNTSNEIKLDRPNSPYGYISGMGMPQVTEIMVKQSESKTEFNYQNAKVLLGTPWRDFKPGRVQLLFGVHSTWIEQNWHVNFYPYINSPVPGQIQYNSRHNSSWGIGLNAMGKFDANLGKGFSFGVNGFVSALIGQQSLKAKAYTNPILNPYYGFSNYYQSPSYQFMSQLMLSPQIAWSRVLKKAAVRIEAAYEFNALLNMLDLYRDMNTYGDPQSGKNPVMQNNSLYLHGLTIRFSAGF